jgi:hypothetical protein
MSKAVVLPPTGWRGAWRRWRFHLSVLCIAIPIAFAPRYFAEEAMERGEAGLGAREIGEIEVGPWKVRMAEQFETEPVEEGEAGYTKGFTIALCDVCAHSVKAAYLKTGKARSLRAAGFLFYGTPYRQTAEIVIPETASADESLTLTLEGWNGEVHHAAIPIAEASPVTAQWLRKTASASR